MSNCKAQNKVSKVLTGYGVIFRDGEYLIPIEYMKKVTKYVNDLQKYAYGVYGLPLQSTLLRVDKATHIDNRGYNKVIFYTPNFEKLQTLVGEYDYHEKFRREDVIDYESKRAQGERNIIEKVQDAYQEQLDQYRREVEDFNRALEELENDEAYSLKSNFKKPIVKTGVSDIFLQNKELSSIGTPEQYSAYLDTIFPNSKLKDIVYHGGDTTDFIEREEWTYFTNDKKYASNYGKVHFAILNITKGKVLEDTIDKTNIAVTYKKALANADGVIGKESMGIVNKNGKSFLANGQEVVAVRKPEQIHILGSQADIQGFKNWVDINQSNTPNEEDFEDEAYSLKSMAQGAVNKIPGFFRGISGVKNSTVKDDIDTEQYDEEISIDEDTIEKRPVRNSYAQMLTYRKNLLNKSITTLRALSSQIKALDKNPIKKAELIETYNSLKEFVYGNESKGIEGIMSEQTALEQYEKDYATLKNNRDEIEKDLHFASLANDTDAIEQLEGELSAINQRIHDIKYEDMTSILRNHIITDLNRAKALAKSGNLDSTKEALAIVNYYKALETNNSFGGNRINPFFTKEELDSGELSPNLIKDLQEFVQMAKDVENIIFKESRVAIMNYINGSEQLRKSNKGKKFTEEDIFRDETGLPDISTVDMYLSDVNDPFYSGSKVQAVLLQAIRKKIDDEVRISEAKAKNVEDKIDEQQEEVNKELIRLGQTLDKDENFKKSWSGLKTMLGVKLNGRANYSFFRQRNLQGIVKNRLVQRANSSFEDFNKKSYRIFQNQIAKLRGGDESKTYEEILYNYHNRMRSTTRVIKPHLLNDVYESDQAIVAREGSKVNLSQTTLLAMDNYKNELIEEYGEVGYQDIIKEQKILLENYRLAKERLIEQAKRNYREENDLAADAEVQYEQLDQLIQDQIENWELDNNPFNIGYLFENNKRLKITRTGEGRANHYSNFGTSFDYNVSLPRAKEMKIVAQESGNFNFRKVELEQTNKDLGYLDERYREIQDNPILKRFYDTMSEASDIYEESLFGSEDLNYWEKGTIPLDKKFRIKRFIEESDRFTDGALGWFSDKYRQLLYNVGLSISNTAETASDFSDVDMTTNTVETRINAASINSTKRRIHREVYVVKGAELITYLADKGMKLKDKDLTPDKEFKLENIPTNLFQEALHISEEYTVREIKRMSRAQLVEAFKETFNIQTKFSTNKTTGSKTDITSINILGLLEDLYTQQSLLENNEDLGLVMRKAMAESALISARKRAQSFVEFMADFYKGIKERGVTSFGDNITLAKNNDAVKLGEARANALKQFKGYMDNIFYLGSDRDNRVNYIASKEEIEEKKSRFFNRFFLKNKDKVELIDEMLKSSDLSPRMKNQLRSAKATELRYISYDKLITGNIQGTVRAAALAWKLFNNLNNLQQGQLAIYIEDGKGTYWERGMYAKTFPILAQAFVRNVTGVSSKLDKGLTPAAAKARHIIDRLQIIEDASTLEAKALHRNKTGNHLIDFISPYGLIKKVEYQNQGAVILAMLMSQKIKDKNGKESNVWDALDEKGKLKPNFRYDQHLIDTWEKHSTQEFFDFKEKTELARDRTAGNYQFRRNTLINQNPFGKMAMNLKRWMPELLARYYGNSRIDYASGKEVKGINRSYHPVEMAAIRFITSSAKLGPTYGIANTIAMLAYDLYIYNNTDESQRPSFRESYDRMTATMAVAAKTLVGIPVNFVTAVPTGKVLIDANIHKTNAKLAAKGMSEVDIANINAMGRTIGVHMIYTAILAGILYYIKGIAFADDDEEEEKEAIKKKKEGLMPYYTRKEIATMAYNVMSTGFSEGVLYLGAEPSKLFTQITSIATLKFLENSYKLIGEFDKMIEGTQSWEYGTGENKGKNRIAVKAKKLLPVPFRDVEIYSKKPFETNYISKKGSSNTEGVKKTEFKNLRTQFNTKEKEAIEDLTLNQMRNLYDKYEYKLIETKNGEKRSLESIKRGYLKRRLEDVIPTPNKKGVKFVDAKKDAEKVLKGEMTSSEYKAKYIKKKD